MLSRVVVIGAALLAVVASPRAEQPQPQPVVHSASISESTDLDAAQLEFYNGRYAAAAALTNGLCSPTDVSVGACELHTTALLFQIKSKLGSHSDKDAAWKRCPDCPGLLASFRSGLVRGQSAARAQLQSDASHEAVLFLLGKLDLNHVWLHLGILGRKTGWGEYWEARRALDKVLARNPHHVRARVARAWIDYIVDTKMPRGTRWLLGGGNKKRGLFAVREAANADASFFVRAEARFALWDMQVRERNVPAAVATAVDLARDFPENQELNRFIETHR